jgi:hypothetical protein
MIRRLVTADTKLHGPAMVMDSHLAERLIAERAASGADRYDEVWEGLYVMNPLADDDHQELVQGFSSVFQIVIVWTGLGKVRPGVNLSDRDEDWVLNYRAPDVAVFLNDCPARNLFTHWQGGPDFLIEILSRGDRSREKLDFYAQLKVREVLLVDRSPWALELYRLKRRRLVRVGLSTLKKPARLESSVLPVAFRLLASEPRPQVEVTHQDGKQRWLI